MERACSQERNRLVRIRMLGGVGRVTGETRAPIPIALLCFRQPVFQYLGTISILESSHSLF